MTDDDETLKRILKSVKKLPLLTPEEEFALITEYQALRRPILNMFEKSYPDFKPKEVLGFTLHALLNPNTNTYSVRAKQIQDILVSRNMRLVSSYSKKFNGGSLTSYDLFVAGIMGLIYGINKFDLNKKHKKTGATLKLSTYVTWWIRHYLQRACQNQSRSIRIPIHKHDELNRLRKAYGEYCSTHADAPPPTPQQLAKLTGFDVKLVQELGTYLFEIGSLDEFSNEEENLTMGSFLEAPETDQPESGIEAHVNKINLIKLLEQLPPDDCKFMMLLYGIHDGLPRKPKEMANAFDIKASEVIKREKQIIDRLKELGNAENFSL